MVICHPIRRRSPTSFHHLSKRLTVCEVEDIFSYMHMYGFRVDSMLAQGVDKLTLHVDASKQGQMTVFIQCHYL